MYEMQQLCKSLLMLYLILPAIIYSKDCQHTDHIFRCVDYVKNYDGDTVTVNIPGVHEFFAYHIAIRLRGIDAPEIRTKNTCEKQKALEAKAFVKNTLESAHEIELHSIQRGKYFRIIADIYADGLSLSTLLLKKGLAVPYDGGKKKIVDWCQSKR